MSLTYIGKALCECGHPLHEHADSGWGPATVCVEKLPAENDGWYGVCPCVRRDDDSSREYPVTNDRRAGR